MQMAVEDSPESSLRRDDGSARQSTNTDLAALPAHPSSSPLQLSSAMSASDSEDEMPP